MNKYIWRIALTFVFLTGSLTCKTLFAETNLKIGVIPFSIEAVTPNPKLQSKIPLMIIDKLEQEGATVEFLTAYQGTESWNSNKFRQIGIESGVDYILTGSIFVAGESISINSTLINTFDKKNIRIFYADADKPESLFSAISKISQEIVGELYHKKIITDIIVIGNKRVEADAIIGNIKTQTGDIIKPSAISKDLRTIYQMGYFDDVVVKDESHDNGVKVFFEVTEKASVRRIGFKGNHVYETEELIDIISVRTGSILNIHQLNSDIDRIRLLYTEKNYHNCSITYDVIPIENSQADIVFNVKEGEKVRVESITFEGNKYFSDEAIKKAMETSEKGFFSFITSSGDLNETEVSNDVIRIESLYKNNGFIDTKVSDPVIDIGKKSISIHFKIKEGDQYTIEKIDVNGDLIISKKELLDVIQSKESKLYNREDVRKDILTISDIYSDKGFANVNVSPLTQKNDQKKMMSIIFSINKGDPVYFNRINISGNLKTRDKVIRREIKVVEQDLYSKKNIQRSFTNLNRLDYFADIDVKPVKTTDEDQMDLNISVVEKKTGSFSIGGGFSSSDGGFMMGSVEERNFLGKGQTVKLSTTFGTDSVLYNLSFFEPYIMDTNISGGIQIYKMDQEYDHYDKDAIGMTLNIGYKLKRFDYTRIGMSYNIESFDIDNVDTSETDMIPGSYVSSSIKPYIQYDSRNDIFLPTEGSTHKFSIEYGGEFLGGEIDYTKYLVENSLFFPLFWKLSGSLHAEGGYLDDRNSSNVDIDYLRFYLGGMSSIRGFDSYDIDGKRDGDDKDVGGEKYVQFNVEVLYEFSTSYQLAAVLFYDRGDVYRTSEDLDFADQFSSFGTGIRWNSPMGPLRIEYAWVIEGKNVKNRGDGQFEFSVGAFF